MNWKNVITALYLILIGMGIVFFSLFLLMQFIILIGWIERGLNRLKRKETVPVPVDLKTEGVSFEEEAVIAAAVAETLSEKVKIHHIKLVQDDDQEAWSALGRMDLMRSHNLPTPK